MATEAEPRRPLTPPPAGRRRRALTAVAVLCGLLALLTAASLPFAPVRHDRPVVSWPQDPAAPVSTSLLLVAHRPAGLAVTTSCATARAAAATDDGLLLATQRPQDPASATEGLLWWVTEGQLRLDVAGTLVDARPVPTGDCALELVTEGTSVRLLQDGEAVGTPSQRLPDVDSLVTSLTRLSPAAGEQLDVRVAVNDEFASSPTPLKTALVVLLVLSSASGLACLALRDRAERASVAARAGARLPRWPLLRPRWWDAAVVALVVAWTFLAPMTDDDGYYAAMSRNVGSSGYVGQYYQLYDQSFVPLTWPWYALSGWLGIADSTVWVRLPAMVLGLVTWLALRRAADLLIGGHERWGTGGADGSGRARAGVVGLLALAFATAWTPYDMGVRPEGIGAAGSALALVGVLTFLRTDRRLPLALGVLAAALACAAHPTGAVAVAPLVALAPRLWQRLRAPSALGTAARLLTVVAPGAVVTAAGFADGTLHDFRRGREVFKAIELPLTWTDEIRRYQFLLADDPMGAYAKRTVVLLALLAVLLGALVVVAARARGLAEDAEAGPLGAVVASVLLAFVALWLTPSKWTHHFGSLAGLVPLLLLLLLLLGPSLVRRAFPGRAGAAGVGAVGGVVAVAALSMSGPNAWPYSWQLGLPHPGVPPYLSVVRFGSPLWWLLGAAAVAVLLRVTARRRDRGARPLPGTGWVAEPGRGTAVQVAATTAVALMVVSTGYLVSTFALAATATADGYSPGAARLTDPLDRSCSAAGAITVADDTRAEPLARAAGTGATAAAVTSEDEDAPAFTEGSGWWAGDPPPGTPGSGQLADAWGSLDAGVDAQGELLTPWYDLGGALADEGADLTALVAGQLTPDSGSSVVAEYGVREGGAVRTTTVQPLGDGAWTSEWRTVRLGGPADPADQPPAPAQDPDQDPAAAAPYDPDLAAAADVVRLRAVDGSAQPGGWVAVASPAVLPLTTMAERLPADAVVATSWQLTYHFPCQRQVSNAHGISDRPDYAVLVGGRPFEGVGDSVWQPGRGGLYAQVPGAATLTELDSRFTDAPEVAWGQLARVDWPYAPSAYDLRLEREVRSGLAGPTVPALG